jgi:hypothetical protein
VRHVPHLNAKNLELLKKLKSGEACASPLIRRIRIVKIYKRVRPVPSRMIKIRISKTL